MQTLYQPVDQLPVRLPELPREGLERVAPEFDRGVGCNHSADQLRTIDNSQKKRKTERGLSFVAINHMQEAL
jgi:hypothetical protein